MTRRGRSTDAGGSEVGRLVRFICTDRHRHRPKRVLMAHDRRQMDWLREWLGDEPGFQVGSGGTRRSVDVRTRVLGRNSDGGSTWLFGPCTQCGRHPQLREEKVCQLLDGLYASEPGRVEFVFDVSYLE